MLPWPTRELQLLDTQQYDLSTILPTVSNYLLRVWIMNSLRVATFTFVVYDIIMTFDREVYYIWRSRWTFAKSIFLINRYIPPVVLGHRCVFAGLKVVSPYATQATTDALACSLAPANSYNRCGLGGILLALMDIVIILVTSSVSTIRVWAIYQRDTKVLVLLVLAFVVCFAPPIAIVSSAKLLSRDSHAARDAELSERVNASMYFVGIKATLCSHIILRLRSYFSEDSIVYSSERTTLEGEETLDLNRTIGTTIQISTPRHSRPPRKELEWTDGPDPKRPKSLAHRSLYGGGRNVQVATGYPNTDAAANSRRSRTDRRSTSWLGRTDTPEGGRISLVLGDSSDKVPSDLELDEFTPESSQRDVHKGV
ncbi:hypothetical protein FRC01_002075 [Tulasnella sp. 417]|nr:hypothetical protein FRC01_002075 [Tulasnella sp. 417]